MADRAEFWHLLNDRQRHIYNLSKRGRRWCEKVDRLAQIVGAGVRTVKRDLAHLAAVGAIEKECHGRHGVRIVITAGAASKGARSGPDRGQTAAKQRGQNHHQKPQKSDTDRETTLTRARVSGSHSTSAQSPISGSELNGECREVGASAPPPEPETSSGGGAGQAGRDDAEAPPVEHLDRHADPTCCIAHQWKSDRDRKRYQTLTGGGLGPRARRLLASKWGVETPERCDRFHFELDAETGSPNARPLERAA